MNAARYGTEMHIFIPAWLWLCLPVGLLEI